MGIDAMLREAVAAGVVPAVVAGHVTRDGRMQVFAHGRDAAGRPVDARTLFWIASMTKTITSVAAMQLVGRGMPDPDAPLAPLLPGLARPQILEGFDADGRPRLHPATRAITLGQLLSHTSGFAEAVWSRQIETYLRVTGHPSTATGRRAALDLPLLFEPGTDWHYGISHDWAGLAIEAASGMRLDRYFERGLLAPLGMADTTYAPTPGQAARQAAVFRRGADGSLARIERNLPADREFLSGGGTMYSTAPDYLAFLRMLLDNGRAPDGTAVLPPGAVARMAESRTAGMRVSCLDPAMPEMSNAVELLPGVRKAWGLGTMVTLDDIPGARRAGSLAWGGLGNTYYWADPAAGVGGVLLTQVLPFADPAVLRLFDAFERAVYAAA